MEEGLERLDELMPQKLQNQVTVIGPNKEGRKPVGQMTEPRSITDNQIKEEPEHE